MLFFGKENIFMCLVAFQKIFQKIFFDVWFCSWKYHRKHIFYLLLIFSHIFSVAKRIYNIIHSSKYKQNPEKNHQIQTLRVIGASHNHDWRFARSVQCRWSRRTISANSTLDDIGELGFERSLLSLLSFSLSLSFSCSLSLLRVTQKWFEGKMKV